MLGTVEQHGGSITVESEPGHGTTFCMFLPAEESTGPAHPDSANMGQAKTGTASVEILVVEDQEMVGSVISRMLERYGHKTILARNAREAEQMWRAHPDIAIVICDVMMPEIRGPELIEHLIQKGADPKVLFVTGYSEETLDDSLSAPVLTKPFSPAALQRAVNELLGT